MKKILLEDVLILNIAKFARFLVHALPFRFSLFMGRRIGTLVYYTGKRRKVAYKNLRAAFAGQKTRAEMKAIAKQSVKNLAMSAIELLRFPDLDKKYLDEHVRILGTEKFENYSKEGKGILFLTAHFGNWELLNASAGLLGYSTAVLARVQKHPRSNGFLNSLRASKGAQIIYKGIAIREILRALKVGKIVGILSDQDGGRNGTFVNFFNRLSSSPVGVATFAFRTGAPIFPVFIFRENTTYHRVEVEAPLEMPAITSSPKESERFVLQQFADRLEAKIRKAPDQWLWAHRRWKSTPDRSVLILSDGKAGHLNQSLAFFEAFKEERAARGVAAERTHLKIVEIRFKSKRHKKIVGLCEILFGGHLFFRDELLKTCLEKDSYEALERTYADVVVSCGSSLLSPHLWAKHENDAKSVVMMKPMLSAKHFEAVIVPKHDKMKSAQNIFFTQTAPSLMTQGYLEKESRELFQHLGISKNGQSIGLLVGGDTDQVKFDPKTFSTILQNLDRCSADAKALLFATSSRRTPVWADLALKESFGENKRCPLLVIANESNRAGVVGGILGSCDVLVVSGESISMISEAVSSGKRVIVFLPAKETALKPKYQEFINKLVGEKALTVAKAETIYEEVKKALSYNPNQAPSFLSSDKSVLRQAAARVAS